MKFEPVSLDHAARLIEERPWEVSRSSTLLADALLNAAKTYGQETCIVGIDIYNVEAEAYGCTVGEPQGNGVPVVAGPIADSAEEICGLRLDPERGGRIPLLLEAGHTIARAAPDCEVRIAMAGPFTIACHLFGIENMICELLLNPDGAIKALRHLTQNQIEYGKVIADNGFGITLFESSVTPPLLSPRLFADHVAPALGGIINELKDTRNSGIQLIIGGNTLPILETLISIRPQYIICPAETDQQAFMSRAENQPELTVRVNMSPSVFFPGRKDRALKEAQRVVELAKGRRKTTTGCLLPFDADPAVVTAVADHVRQQI